jgi:hypothetical protein
MSRSKTIKAIDFQAPTGIGSPLDIPGAFVWLDAANVGGGVDADPSDADPIDTWRDKSGNANDFTAVGTGSTRPVFRATGMAGEPTVEITGSTHGLAAGAGLVQPAGAYTIAFVGQQSGGTFYLFDVNSNHRFLYWLNNSGSGNWYYQDAFLGTPGVAEGSILYNLSIFDEARTPTAELRENGAIIRTDSSYTAQSFDSSFRIGSRYTGENTSNWAGLVSELVMFDRALNAEEIALLEGYFATKWGIL